jgi:AbrB family looped-hinge helix DNA binding protein
MPIGKIGQRRQVVIPKDICESLGLETGDFVEVTQVERTIVIKPKRLVDADDVLTPEEEVIIKEGERQLREGESRSWQHIKHDLAR